MKACLLRDANAVAERVQGMQIWFTIAVFAGFFYAARLVSRGITKPLAECVDKRPSSRLVLIR